MLYLEVIKGLTNRLADRTATQAFMDAVEFRHRLFRTNRANACFMDPYDLVSDHLMLRSTVSREVVAYVRATSETACRTHELEYPIETVVKRETRYAEPYARYRASARESLHMNLLCMDPRFRRELEGIKIVDLMIWLGFRESGLPREALSFTATPNAKYRQDPWLKKIGPWTADVPDFVHPVIPEPHRFVLIPEISELYWKVQEQSYAALYRSLREGPKEAVSSAA